MILRKVFKTCCGAVALILLVTSISMTAFAQEEIESAANAKEATTDSLQAAGTADESDVEDAAGEIGDVLPEGTAEKASGEELTGEEQLMTQEEGSDTTDTGSGSEEFIGTENGTEEDSSEETEEPEPVVVPVAGIKLENTPSVMATNETAAVDAVLTPADTTQQDLIWSSSDESVATVDDTGKVTALRYGEAVISAVSADNPRVMASFNLKTMFYDVNGSADKGSADYQYYYTPVYWAAERGITKGYDRVYFGPQRSCERREMMIFLWRLVGSPNASGNMPFTDVSAKYGKNTDTYKAILWGYRNGIVKGFSATQFKPGASVTRKDTLIMLYRLAGKPKVSGNISFPDVISQHYGGSSDTYSAILWGYYTGITNGYEDGNFRPVADCLREHIVTFIYRFTNIRNMTLSLNTPKLTGCDNVSNGVKVTWNKVSNASYYIVYLKNSNGSLTKLGTTKNTSYTYTKAKSGSVYTFTVVAKNGRVESDYDETGISNDAVMAMALSRLKACGGTLKSAFNWSVSIPYQNQPAVYYARGYAEWSFNNHAGDCLGKAATFYMMAKALGYDVKLMYGYVPQRGGGMVDHGWVEIKYNGAWYVCDPDFEYESGNNGYFINYGQSGTWMYTDYYALNY